MIFSLGSQDGSKMSMFRACEPHTRRNVHGVWKSCYYQSKLSSMFEFYPIRLNTFTDIHLMSSKQVYKWQEIAEYSLQKSLLLCVAHSLEERKSLSITHRHVCFCSTLKLFTWSRKRGEMLNSDGL